MSIDDLIETNKDIRALIDGWESNYTKGATYNKESALLKDKLLYKFIEFNINRYRHFDYLPKDHYLRWENENEK